MWQQLQDTGGLKFMSKAFVPFLTAGDPNLDITKELILTMEQAGADLIEIGIPFSDPVAEGIVIQKADLRALSAGTTTDKIFDMVMEVRKETSIPLAFMTYVNPIYVYGTEKFAKRCRECQVDKVIIPDVPFEEKHEMSDVFEKFGIDVISLIAPTSKDRILMIAKEAKGFLYCVSSLGVTGVRSELTYDVGEMIAEAKKVTDAPCYVGFGISTPEQARKMSEISDGVIVGSAIVKIIEAHGVDAKQYVYDYVKEMKEACLKCE